MRHLGRIVDDLDEHLLLPQAPHLTKEIKEKRVKWAVRLMIDERETIPARSATIYSACQIALKRAKSQIKIARSSSI
jgi:ribosomal protein L14E/L6E/L27E